MIKQILLSLFIITLLFVPTQAYEAADGEEKDVNTHSNYQQVALQSLNLDVELIFERSESEKQILEGKAVLQFTTLKQISEVLLDVWGIGVSKVKYSDSESQGEDLQSEVVKGVTPEGDTLKITLKKQLEAQKSFSLEITYNINHPYGPGLTFLEKEQTVNKEQPMFYTQFEPINGRSFVPIQDTPAVKFTWKINVTVPSQDLNVFMSGKFIESKPIDSKMVHTFEQTQKVPLHSIALLVGKFDKQKISTDKNDIAYIIAEPKLMTQAKNKFKNLDLYIKLTAKVLDLTFPWDSYNLVIMPPNYPFEGMQHPYLTYVSPSVLDAGETGTSVVLHEIAKAWFGDLVTSGNWRNLWLNEGFAQYVEREAQQLIFESSFKELDRVVGNIDMMADIQFYGEEDSFTSLYPKTQNINPVDVFTVIPQEKGYQFLLYLESFLTVSNMQKMLKSWVTQKQYKSVEWGNFKSFFESWVKANMQQQSDFLSQINWEDWITKPGYIPKGKLAPFTSTQYTTASQLAYVFLQFSGTAAPVNYFEFFGWNSDMKYAFIDFFLQKDNLMMTTRRLCRQLDQLYQFSKNYDDQDLLFRWYTLTVFTGYDREVTEQLSTFLGLTGRIKFLTPIYGAYQKSGRHNIGEMYYQSNKDFYHPTARQEIEEVLGDSIIPNLQIQYDL